MQAIDTSPVGFAIFDRVLLTVHPTDCAVREFFAQRLAQAVPGGGEARASARLPTSPADLMLRMVNHMVDSYLELRRLLTRQLGYLQQSCCNRSSRARRLAGAARRRATRCTCSKTPAKTSAARSQEWIDALAEWPVETSEPGARASASCCSVRSRDVLEHIERVLAHVRRLEQSAETAVQMHFSAQSHRTNDIMRTLTVLTAIFLPLNLSPASSA